MSPIQLNGQFNGADPYPTRPFNPSNAVMARPIDPFNRFKDQATLANKAVQGAVLKKDPPGDYALASTDDVLKRGGSVMIATLATLGAVAPILGISEFIGFASWFLAMAFTPKVGGWITERLTGVNPNWEYTSSQAERKRLLMDSQYIPQVLSDEKINKIADKLGVSKTAPNRRELTEQKIQQIASQTNTWWMLIAGPATPVLSGLISDLTIEPLTKLYQKAKGLVLARQVANPQGASTQAIQNYIEHLSGDTMTSSLSTWWRDFGRGLVEHTQMKKSFAPLDAFPQVAEDGVLNKLVHRLTGGKGPRPLNEAELNQRILEHFMKLQQQGAESVELRTLNGFLKQQQEAVEALQQSVLKQLDNPAKAIDFTYGEKVRARFSSALQTVKNYQGIVQEMLETNGKVPLEKLKQRFEAMSIVAVTDLDERGVVNTLFDLLGGNLRKIQQKMWAGQFANASKDLGAPPMNFLKTALKDTMAHKIWKTRIVYLLGGGLLAATALYNLFFVGKNVQQKEGHRMGPAWYDPKTTPKLTLDKISLESIMENISKQHTQRNVPGTMPGAISLGGFGPPQTPAAPMAEAPQPSIINGINPALFSLYNGPPTPSDPVGGAQP